MIRGLGIGRNRLQFPGTAPSLNVSHPAAYGGNGTTVGGIYIAAVAFPSAAILLNLTSPVRSLNSVTGTPSSVYDGLLGPCVFFGNGTTDVLSSSATTYSFSGGTGFCTHAAIFRLSALTTTQTFLSNSSATVSFALSTTAISISGTGGSTSFTVSLTAGVPYFIACSVASANNGQAVIKNLQTGAAQIVTSTGHSGGYTLSTQLRVGNNGGGTAVLNGRLAAILSSHAYLTASQLLQWADDPWALWYPDRTFAVSNVFMSQSQTTAPVAENVGMTGIFRPRWNTGWQWT